MDAAAAMKKLCDYAVGIIMKRQDRMEKRKFVMFPVMWAKIRMWRIKRIQRLAKG